MLQCLVVMKEKSLNVILCQREKKSNEMYNILKYSARLDFFFPISNNSKLMLENVILCCGIFMLWNIKWTYFDRCILLEFSLDINSVAFILRLVWQQVMEKTTVCWQTLAGKESFVPAYLFSHSWLRMQMSIEPKDGIFLNRYNFYCVTIFILFEGFCHIASWLLTMTSSYWKTAKDLSNLYSNLAYSFGLLHSQFPISSAVSKKTS